MKRGAPQSPEQIQALLDSDNHSFILFGWTTEHAIEVLERIDVPKEYFGMPRERRKGLKEAPEGKGELVVWMGTMGIGLDPAGFYKALLPRILH